MSDKIENLLVPGRSGWLASDPEAGIIVSSRIRLARNLDGELFPEWATEDDNSRTSHELADKLRGLDNFKDSSFFEMNNLNRTDKEVLVERRLISRELAAKSSGSGVMVTSDESVSVMINEEDHIRMQTIQPGLKLWELWSKINEVDSAAESALQYAFSPVLGYLTACPSNVGTGMRASAMLHLPGLVLMNEINPVMRGINKIGLAVRGLWGEGTDAAGNMFQLSNQITLGDTEEHIIKRLEQVILEVAEHEKNARTRLMEKKEMLFKDHSSRAIGLLTHAYMLNSRETLDMLSALRFGIEMGLIDDWEKSLIDELFLLIQTGHLQKNHGKSLGSEKRDILRATLVREKLLKNRKKRE